MKLNADFERTLNRLIEKYGEEFQYINGIHPSQLDYSEFINNFIKNDTLADTTVDPNANSNHRDIRSFMTEKGKSSDKLFGLNKIFETIKNGTVNSKVNAQNLSVALGISLRTTKRDLYVLRDMNLIHYVGSDKTGHWEVIKESD